MPGRLGGRSVLRRGRKGKNGKQARREEGERAVIQWPVASLHHPLSGLGSSSSVLGKKSCYSQHDCKRSIVNKLVKAVTDTDHYSSSNVRQLAL